MRLFVAVELSSAWIEALRAVQARLRALDTPPSVRWVRPEGIHLTLRFLGEVDDANVEPLRAGVDAALSGHEPPVLAPDALGAFPNVRRARVGWVGVREEGARLEPLQHDLEQAVRGLGWAAETRAFHPHLTLGRARDPRRGVSAALASSLAREHVHRWEPREEARVALMRSHLSPRGARYEALHVWRLGSTGAS